MKTKSWIIISLVLMGVWGLTGCVVIPTSGGKTIPSTSTEAREPKSVGNVDFYPKARRLKEENGQDSVLIWLQATGTFTDEILQERTYDVTPQRKLSVGILPGMASLNPGSVVGGTLLAIWYNILFLGTPTLNGLLVEPFNPYPVPDSQTVNDGHAFRRSALLGFHKYELPEKMSKRKTQKTKMETVTETRNVDGVVFSFGPDSPSNPQFWEKIGYADGFVILYGVTPNEHVGTLTLEYVPETHYMRRNLAPLLGFKMKVTIPAE